MPLNLNRVRLTANLGKTISVKGARSNLRVTYRYPLLFNFGGDACEMVPAKACMADGVGRRRGTLEWWSGSIHVLALRLQLPRDARQKSCPDLGLMEPPRHT